jgi:hypothetical protein
VLPTNFNIYTAAAFSKISFIRKISKKSRISNLKVYKKLRHFQILKVFTQFAEFICTDWK